MKIGRFGKIQKNRRISLPLWADWKKNLEKNLEKTQYFILSFTFQKDLAVLNKEFDFTKYIYGKEKLLASER